MSQPTKAPKQRKPPPAYRTPLGPALDATLAEWSVYGTPGLAPTPEGVLRRVLLADNLQFFDFAARRRVRDIIMTARKADETLAAITGEPDAPLPREMFSTMELFDAAFIAAGEARGALTEFLGRASVSIYADPAAWEGGHDPFLDDVLSFLGKHGYGPRRKERLLTALADDHARHCAGCGWPVPEPMRFTKEGIRKRGARLGKKRDI
ncbi:MAG: hypothetical protein IT371_14305 [Deltaproteobacteria bacterium]|nr:hypothetical protein [Deltaproteobacteria bacterium]